MYFSLALLISIISAQSGPPPQAPLEPRMVNGWAVNADEYPFIANLRYWSGASFENYCGASIIRMEYPATILTAAHCLVPLDGQRIGISLLRDDANDPYSDENDFITYEAAGYIWHTGYDRNTVHNDIGIVFLAVDLTKETTNKLNQRLRTAYLPTPNECGQSKGEQYIELGYGWANGDGRITDNGSPYTDTLECGFKYFVPMNECVKEHANVDQNGNLCAESDTQDSCAGDSGGPLVRDLGNGVFVQCGVISWGAECGKPPTVYARVENYVGWIQDQIDEFMAKCLYEYSGGWQQLGQLLCTNNGDHWTCDADGIYVDYGNANDWVNSNRYSNCAYQDGGYFACDGLYFYLAQGSCNGRFVIDVDIDDEPDTSIGSGVFVLIGCGVLLYVLVFIVICGLLFIRRRAQSCKMEEVASDEIELDGDDDDVEVEVDGVNETERHTL